MKRYAACDTSTGGTGTSRDCMKIHMKVWMKNHNRKRWSHTLGEARPLRLNSVRKKTRRAASTNENEGIMVKGGISDSWLMQNLKQPRKRRSHAKQTSIGASFFNVYGGLAFSHSYRQSRQVHWTLDL